MSRNDELTKQVSVRKRIKICLKVSDAQKRFERIFERTFSFQNQSDRHEIKVPKSYAIPALTQTCNHAHTHT